MARAAGDVLLAHVSDPHFGRHEPAAVAALLEALNGLRPALVVVGGDLAHRARRAQFEEGLAFLRALDSPWLAIPGNHDIPLYDLFRRVFSPLGRYHRMVTVERDPLFVAPGLRVLGLDSTRRKVTGRLTAERIASIPRLAGGDPGALRVLVTHHPLVRRPCDGAAAALAAAAQAGADVLLAGHHHRAHVTPSPPAAILAVEAPSPSHRLEPVTGFYLLRATATEIAPELWTYDGRAFLPGQARPFPRRNHRAAQR